VAGDLGLPVVARLKNNLPTLLAAAAARFTAQPPTLTLDDGGERIELWDADDFDPWATLRWPTVRVLRYRQHQRQGAVVEAYWLTDLPPQRVSSRLLYRFAKSRWEIENAGFNDGKTRHGMASHAPPRQQLAGRVAVDDLGSHHRAALSAAVSASRPPSARDGNRVRPRPPAQLVSAPPVGARCRARLTPASPAVVLSTTRGPGRVLGRGVSPSRFLALSGANRSSRR
jgi:hypothetical protein